MRPTTFADFVAFDDALAAKGHPPTGAFWRGEAAAYFASGALSWIACAGRGSAKSTLLYRLATFEALFGDYTIPPGERHWAMITSRLKEEASKAISVIASELRALKVPHVVIGDSIELADLPRGIRVTAPTVAAASGPRAFFDGNDEIAKWQADGAVSVDAVEVVTSKRAMTATHPTARHCYFSSPFVDEGVFFDFVQSGSSRLQYVTPPTPTWIASDNRITEAMTLDLEPNPRAHAREYGAQFGAAWNGGYFPDAIVTPNVANWEWRPRVDGERVSYVLALDAGYVRDNFAIAVAHVAADGRIVIDRVEAMTPRKGAPLTPTECLERVRQLRDFYGARSPILADQFGIVPLTTIAESMGLALEPRTWTGPSKATAFASLSGLLRDRRITLPNDPALLRELGSIGVKLTSAGNEQIGARGNGRDDRVMALALLVGKLTAPSPAGKMLTAMRSLIERGGADGLALRLAQGLAPRE